MPVTILPLGSTLKRSRSAMPALLLLWSFLIILVAASGASVAWGAEAETVAMVNGEPVTRAELQRMLADPLEQQLLQQELGVPDPPDSKEVEHLALRKLIHRRLLLQEAGRRKITVSEQDLDQAIAELRRRFKDLESFGLWMHERGLNDQSLFESVRADMLTDRTRAALAEEVRLTEEQIHEYYETHKKDFKRAGDVRLRIIAVKDKTAAEEVMAALKAGEDFAALARKRSLGLRAKQGGDTGWINPQTLPPPLQKAAGTLKAGEISGLLQRDNEFLIVQLAGQQPAQTLSLAATRAVVERRLLAAKKREAVQVWLTEQERRSAIQVFP